MKKGRRIVACLCAVLLGSAILTIQGADAHGHGKQTDYKKKTSVATQPVLTKNEEALQILVSPSLLKKAGIQETENGNYRVILPEKTGVVFQNNVVDLTFPTVKEGNGTFVDVTYIKDALRLKLEGSEGTIAVTSPQGLVVLKDAVENKPVDKAQAGGVDLMWDPEMNAENLAQRPTTGTAVISPTAFRVTPSGVTIHKKNFDTYVGAYKKAGYKIWPLVDNNFNPTATHEFLVNKSVREETIKRLIGYALLYGFDGYNLDFENINYEDRDELTSFVAAFSVAAHAYGLRVSMDVTPVSASKNWSQVYDRASLAPHLDYLMLMAYDQVGRTSPVPGPCATEPWVESAVRKTLEFIDKDKLVLGMPLYMRTWYSTDEESMLPENPDEWPAPTGSGPGEKDNYKSYSTLKVRTLTMKNSLKIREKYASYIRWNDKEGLYYMNLPLKTGVVQIWFEDNTSLANKRNLIDKYQLAGGAYWRKGFEDADFRNIWSSSAD